MEEDCNTNVKPPVDEPTGPTEDIDLEDIIVPGPSLEEAFGEGY